MKKRYLLYAGFVISIVCASLLMVKNTFANALSDCGVAPPGGDVTACGLLYYDGYQVVDGGWKVYAGAKPRSGGQADFYDELLKRKTYENQKLYIHIVDAHDVIADWIYLGYFNGTHTLADQQDVHGAAWVFVPTSQGNIIDSTISNDGIRTTTYRFTACFHGNDAFEAWKHIAKYSDSTAFCETVDAKRTEIVSYNFSSEAIDVNGKPIDEIPDPSANQSSPVRHNTVVKFTRNDSVNGYTFKEWRTAPNGSSVGTGETYDRTINAEGLVTYAVYERDLFRGSAKVIEKSTRRESGTGMVDRSATANTLYIKCANNSGECDVELEFNIERVRGNGSTTYSAPNDNLNNVSGSTAGGRVGTRKSHRLSLGENKCFSMTFNTQPSLGANGNATLTVCAATPYNFENTVKITDNGTSIVNPGESLDGIVATIKTGTRQNSATGQNYATEVPNASYDIQVNVEGSAEWVSLLGDDEKGTHTLNNDKTNNAGGSERSVKAKNYIVPDLPMGSQICVKALVEPRNSGPATNIDKNSFDYGTNSDSKCYIVAKKPTINVLGGGMYAAQGVETSISEKSKLSGYSDYDVRVYGSFAEHSLNSLGGVSGFASGAATGPVEGSKEDSKSDFCRYRTLLTIANYECDNNNSAPAGNSGVYLDGKIREEILAYWQNKDGVYQSFDGNEITSEAIGDMTGTRFVYVNGDATIKENLEINGEFENISDIPKVIIYAKDNIKINCGVSRIDAILIAGGSVNTCDDYKSEGTVNTDIDKRSRLLTVNGTIISNELIPSRVGGAGTGESSNDPAEIINYDSSILLWEKAMGEGNNKNNNLVDVYQKELAPRY